jgi:hypothetical protein
VPNTRESRYQREDPHETRSDVVAFVTALTLPALIAAPAAGAADDRGKLYEAAKKEGEVTLATSGPAEQREHRPLLWSG